MKAIRKGLGTPRDIVAFSMLPLNSFVGRTAEPSIGGGKEHGMTKQR